MNIFLLGILFAVVGALCGIFAVKSYVGANFVPSSGCSVVGSSVIPNSSLLSDDFVDASFFAAQWTTVNTDVNHTLTLETGNSRVYMLILSAVADACKNVGFRSAQFTGNFDVWMDAETLTYANYISPGIIFYVDDDNFIGFGMKTSNNGAADYPAFHWKIGASLVTPNRAPVAAQDDSSAFEEWERPIPPHIATQAVIRGQTFWSKTSQSGSPEKSCWERSRMAR